MLTTWGKRDVSFLGGSQLPPRNADHCFVTFEDDDAVEGQEGRVGGTRREGGSGGKVSGCIADET